MAQKPLRQLAPVAQGWPVLVRQFELASQVLVPVQPRAEVHLRDTDISLSHLTRELGYAEQSVLSRSCQRWFGMGPSSYRKACRSANSSQPG